MTYRYLPFVRQGLAAEIANLDDGSDLPKRASFPVTLRVAASSMHTASRTLQVYGPGDITGIDTRTILRNEPRRGTSNFSPNQFALIEFDSPDFPWMFTPARANKNGRLRPWLVLIVVEKKDGLRVKTTGGRPLPEIDVPIEELPDLSESWAWAHAQMVEGDNPGSVSDELADHPDLNVSRLMCPRHLEPAKTYLACVVPAFDVGRLAGLNITVPEGGTPGPAWRSGGAGTVTLPVYYHWEFGTGPGGDFESLARKLKPMPVPARVGFRPMFIGAADPAIASLPATRADGGIIDLEGALRSPETGNPPRLTDDHDPLIADLSRVLDSGAQHLKTGARNSGTSVAENVGPPLYGSWAVRQHMVPSAGKPPRWLRELNVDPRHRAAAGLGTEVVKANQERFMDAAWEQVGDVIDGNQALNIARLMDKVSEQLMARHFIPMSEPELFSVTAPMHPRTMLGARVLQSVVAHSHLPGELADPSFRRMASPQNSVLKRAARRNNVAVSVDGSVAISGAVTKLAQGNFEIDLSIPLDGLTATTLLDRLPGAQGGQVNLAPLGFKGTVPATAVQAVVNSTKELKTNPAKKLRLRPDIAKTGILVDRHLARVVKALGDEGSLVGTTSEVIERRRTNRTAVGFIIGRDETSVAALDIDPQGIMRARRADGSTREIARLDPEMMRRRGPDMIATELGRLPLGTFDPDGSAPMVDLRDSPGVGTPVIFQPIPSGEPSITIDPPVTIPSVITEFVKAFELFTEAKGVAFEAPILEAFDLGSAGGKLIESINPKPTIVARVGTRLSVGDQRLLDVDVSQRFRQADNLAPVMFGPKLGEPLYRALAQYDPDRFLPGVGLIPANAMTMVETNQEFVEAFLVGANHEMNRELRWRAFPGDRRATVFHSFWDRVDGDEDIGPIHGFHGNRRLGRNTQSTPGGSIVLLIRGDLLRRYPNSVIFATPATSDKKLPKLLDPSNMHMPVFAGRLDPDITFAGFDLNVETITPDPGFFFVIQQQPTEPHFGLDVSEGAGAGAPPTWSHLTWSHVAVKPGELLSLDTLPESINRRLAGSSGPSARWARNAAHMAAITFQRPFRAAAHTEELLEGIRGTD